MKSGRYAIVVIARELKHLAKIPELDVLDVS